MQNQQNDIIYNVTEIKNNITNITVVNNVLAENKQETLLHDTNIVGVDVIDTNNNIRQLFGVYPIECNLYFYPDDIKNNHIQLSFDSNNTYALRQDITTAINNLIDSSPSTLNTLKEISDAINNDSNFSATIIDLLSQKQNIITCDYPLSINNNTLSIDLTNYQTTTQINTVVNNLQPKISGSTDLIINPYQFLTTLILKL